mgnify:CR=1 FL=1
MLTGFGGAVSWGSSFSEVLPLGEPPSGAEYGQQPAEIKNGSRHDRVLSHPRGGSSSLSQGRCHRWGGTSVIHTLPREFDESSIKPHREESTEGAGDTGRKQLRDPLSGRSPFMPGRCWKTGVPERMTNRHVRGNSSVPTAERVGRRLQSQRKWEVEGGDLHHHEDTETWSKGVARIPVPIRRTCSASSPAPPGPGLAAALSAPVPGRARRMRHPGEM